MVEAFAPTPDQAPLPPGRRPVVRRIRCEQRRILDAGDLRGRHQEQFASHMGDRDDRITARVARADIDPQARRRSPASRFTADQAGSVSAQPQRTQDADHGLDQREGELPMVRTQIPRHQDKQERYDQKPTHSGSVTGEK